MEANYQHDTKALLKIEAEGIFDSGANRNAARVKGSGEFVPLGKVAGYFAEDIIREIEEISL
jgi:hypothetical protein